jgi:hypothetical protein
MYKLYLITILSLSLMQTSCGSTQQAQQQQQPEKPVESYIGEFSEPPTLSNVSIPVKFSQKEIENMLNSKVNGVVYEDNNLEDDGLMVKATKSQNITMSLSGMQMNYRVPLKLWIFKRVFGSRGVEVNGELALNFVTTLSIKSDWTMEPKTEVTGYEWITTPSAKLGLVEIPVKYVANIVLDKSKQTLASGIDQSLKANLNFKKNIEETWTLMQRPVKVNEAYNMWVKLTPQTISMAPMRSNGVNIESTINVASFAEVVSGKTEPTFRPNTSLPSFAIGESKGNEFGVNLTIDIPMKEAEDITRANFVGQTFTPSGKKITVTDIKLYGQNEKLIVNTVFEGSYKGSMYLSGKPTFKSEKNTIEMDDLDYDLSTKNFLLNAGKWLFDKTIQRKIKESCVFPVDEKINTMKTMMNDMLKSYKFNNNVMMSGLIGTIMVQDIKISESGIRVFVTSTGNLNMEVSGLDRF